MSDLTHLADLMKAKLGAVEILEETHFASESGGIVQLIVRLSDGDVYSYAGYDLPMPLMKELNKELYLFRHLMLMTDESLTRTKPVNDKPPDWVRYSLLCYRVMDQAKYVPAADGYALGGIGREA